MGFTKKTLIAHLLLGLGLVTVFHSCLTGETTEGQALVFSVTPGPVLLNGLHTSGVLQDSVIQLGTSVPPPAIWYPRYEVSRSPLRLRVVVRREAEVAFTVHFGAALEGDYFFSYNDHRESENGVFFDHAGELEKVLDTSRLVRATKAAAAVDVILEWDEKKVKASINHLPPVEGPMPSPTINALVRAANLAPSRMTIVDRIELYQHEQEEGWRLVAGNSFHSAPLFFDLAFHVGVTKHSRLYILLSFLMLMGCAMLIEKALSSIQARGVIRGFSRGGLSLLCLPMYAAALLALRASLSLTFPVVAMATGGVAWLAIIQVFREGMGRPPGAPSESRGRLLRWAFAGLGYVAYAGALAMVWDELESFHAASTIRGGLAALPLLLWAATALTSRRFPATALLVASTAFYSIFLLDWFYPHHARLPFFAMTLLPWALGASLHAIRRPRWRWIYATPLLLLTVALSFYSAEICLCASPQIDAFLDYRTRISRLGWDITRYTDVLDTYRSQPTIRVNHREYSRRKAPGTIRVACLGSSSTFGSGASSPHASYPEALARVLNKRTTKRVEVINAGLVASPLTILRVFLEDVVLPLQPDLVILYFGANKDGVAFQRYAAALRAEKAASPFIQTSEEMWAAMQIRGTSEQAIKSFLSLAQSRLFMGALHVAKHLRGFLSQGWRQLGEPPFQEEDFFASPAAIIKACRLAGAKLLLVPEVCHSDVTRGGDERRFHEYYEVFSSLARKHSAEGVHYLNLLPAFTLQRAHSYLIDEMHLNDKGYAFLAQLIANAALKRGLIEGSDSE